MAHLARIPLRPSDGASTELRAFRYVGDIGATGHESSSPFG
jgi:hypothetical protein